MLILAVYLILLLTLGVLDYRKIGNFQDYLLAGRRSGGLLVAFSLMASLIGSGSTMGLVNNVYRIGFPAFWFLAAGGIGLVLQSLVLSEKVRSTGAVSLPHLAEMVLGRPAAILIALIVAVTWIGIISAQFIAVGRLLTALTGRESTLILPGAAAIIILYSFLGGQNSILKTDLLQQGILLAAVLVTLLWLYGTDPAVLSPADFRPLNGEFGPGDLLYYLTLVMGSYFICPMMFSRLLSARNPRTARRSSLAAGLVVLVFALGLVLIGLWARVKIPELSGGDVFSHLFLRVLPRGAGVLLLLGLLSAVISTVDTSLVMTAGIIEHDLLGKSRIGITRLLVLLLGIAGTAAAAGKSDIIGTLLEAFAVYTAGIVPVLFIALMFLRKRILNRPLAFSAVLLGGIAGAAANWTGIRNLALAGLAGSLLLALLAAGLGRPAEAALPGEESSGSLGEKEAY